MEGFIMRKFGLIFTVVFYIFNVCCMRTCFAGNYKFSEIEGLEFETERLILTPTTEDDKKILSGYLLDKDVTRYLGPSMEMGFDTKEEALRYLNGGSPYYNKVFNLTIKLKDNKCPVGNVSIMLKNEWSAVNIGYWLGKKFQGNGYAREACLAVCNKVFNASDISSVLIACDTRNKSSEKLANKILDYLEQNNKQMNLRRKHRTVNIDANVKYNEFLLQKNLQKF